MSHRTRARRLTPALLLLLASPAFGAPQDIQLAFDSLPSAQGFAYQAVGFHSAVPEASVFAVSAGTLIQNTMPLSHGTIGGSILYTLGGIVTTTEVKQLHVTAACLQTEGSGIGAAGQQGFVFGFTTGTVQYGVSLAPTQIFTLGPSGSVTVPGTFDNTQFHDYVLEYTPPGSFRILRDGAQVYAGSSGFAVSANRVFLGDGSGAANAYAEVRAFRFLQDSATPARAESWGRLKNLYQ